VDLVQTIFKRRSIRRFKQSPISKSTIEMLVDCARMAPSSGNKQPLIYVLVDAKALVEQIFTTLRWANYLGEEGTPPEGERPVAYIIVLVDKNISTAGYEYDSGMAIENMILAALEYGIGSCCIGSVDREKLRKILNIPENFIIDLVVALGYPNEEPVAEDMTNSIRYWKDSFGKLHVPKRKLKNIMYWNEMAI